MSTQVSANKLPESVCITGMGICLPVAKGQRAVARALIAGEDAIDHVRSFDGSVLVSDLVSEFDPADVDFSLTEGERACLDRGAWFAVAALEEAIAQAGFKMASFVPERVGVVVGTSHSGIQHIEKSYVHLRAPDSGPVPARWLAAAATGHTASVISARLGVKGPKATVSSACASSNTAVGVGLDWLVRGEVDCVIVVGTDTVSPSILAGFNALRAVGPVPTAPFSAPAGINLGEGAGAVVLERGSGAGARGVQPLAWVRGYGLSGDAYHETATDTEGRGVEAAMRAALADAGVTPGDIDYVSAHGTGTDANDIPEAIATARVVGPATPLSSPKSFLGHTLGASGVVELIITLLFSEKGLIPPTRNFNGIRSGCPDLNYVPNEPQLRKVKHFLCNNYGFGGNNSSLVIAAEPGLTAVRAPDASVVLVSGGAVTAQGGNLAALFDQIWQGAGPIALDPEWGVPAARAHRALVGTKVRANPRSSTMIKAAVAAVQETLAQAGGESLINDAPQRCALIAGVTHGAQRHVEKLMASVLDEGLQYASATHFPLTTMNATAGQISIAFGVKGYNTTFCGAASALHYAHAIVRDGRQDRALTFGADELSPLVMRALDDVGILAREALWPFSGRAGVVPGEGAAALLLERGDLALDRGAPILARLAGIGLAQDGLLDAVNPSGEGLARAALRALTMAGLEAGEVDAVFLGGMGPRDLLLAEASALETIFGARIPPHASAAGLVGLCPSALLPVHCLLAAESLERGTLPPAPGRTEPRRLARARNALVLHTALGGECCAVLLEALEERGR